MAPAPSPAAGARRGTPPLPSRTSGATGEEHVTAASPVVLSTWTPHPARAAGGGYGCPGLSPHPPTLALVWPAPWLPTAAGWRLSPSAVPLTPWLCDKAVRIGSCVSCDLEGRWLGEPGVVPRLRPAASFVCQWRGREQKPSLAPAGPSSGSPTLGPWPQLLVGVWWPSTAQGSAQGGTPPSGGWLERCAPDTPEATAPQLPSRLLSPQLSCCPHPGQPCSPAELPAGALAAPPRAHHPPPPTLLWSRLWEILQEGP